MIVALVLLALAAGATPALGRSQTLLFLAYERTQLLGRALALLPVRPGARPSVRRGSGLAPPGQGRLPEGPRRPQADVILITVDALRADHVGAYGYKRPTTPNIDALAQRGVRFERAYTQAPNTSFASTSILTGKYYPTLARLRPPDGLDTLPLLLRRYGIKTSAFYPPAVFYVEPEKLQAYADTDFHFEYVKEEYLAAPERLGQIKAFFASDRPTRAFLWLHYFEPHETYVRWPQHDFGPSDVDRYDSEIAYVDAAIGQLLAYLERERPGAIVILSADHGEEFDEHAGRYHGTTLYEEQVRVPLIIAVPGVPPHVVQGPVELVDLAPTILGLLDIPIPVRMRGTDLGPWLAQPAAPSTRLPPAFAEVGDLRMVATAADKLICDGKKGFCEYYDLQADPGERKNLIDARPDRVASLRGELEAWLADNTVLESAGGGDSVVPPAIERGRLGDASVALELAGLLASAESAEVKREAARLLVVALPPRPETAPAVRAARRSGDAQIEEWATIAAARLGDLPARQQLGGQLERVAPSPPSPPSPPRGQPADAALAADASGGPAGWPAGGPAERRVFAALVLAEAADPRAVPILTEALASCRDILVCRQIVATLGRSRDPRAAVALVARLPAVIGRREVVEALGQLADPATVPALAERLLEDEYVPVRAQAAAALGAIGGRAADAALQRAARREREAVVKAAIDRAREPQPAASPTP